MDSTQHRLINLNRCTTKHGARRITIDSTCRAWPSRLSLARKPRRFVQSASASQAPPSPIARRLIERYTDGMKVCAAPMSKLKRKLTQEVGSPLVCYFKKERSRTKLSSVKSVVLI
jgi:hypothetical protein